jgi:hypothetical protein
MLPVARQPDRLEAIALGPLDGVEPTGDRTADTRPPTRFGRGPSPSRGEAGLDQFIGQAGGRKQPLAGVAVFTAVWLSRRHNPDAERFARRLTWALLALTVAGNAAHQGLAAAGESPWV